MANTYTGITAANPAVANRFVTTTNMIVGAYAMANTTMPGNGARRITITHTTVTGADTLGTITFVGTNINNQPITEAIVPLAGTVATGTKFFKTVASATGAGWVINTGNDTLVIGCEAGGVVVDGSGTLEAIVVNTTAAGTIILADAAGTIATLASSIAVGTYRYEVNFAGFLRVTTGAASDVTVIHSPSMTFTYGP